MKAQIKTEQTRYPKLTRAVIRQTGRNNLKDIARHGVDGGFNGFIYYADTTAFFRRNKNDILQLAQDIAEDLGEDMLTMIANFNCLRPHYTPTEIGAAIFGNSGEEKDIIQNAMAWLAAEEIARELNPEI